MTTQLSDIMRPTNDARRAAYAQARRPVQVVELPPDAPAELVARMAELAKLRTEMVAIQANLVALENGKNAAERADAADYSAAVRAGKADPGGKHEATRVKDLGDAQRRRVGQRRAIDDALAELLALIEQKGEDWIAAAQPTIEAARKAANHARNELNAAELKLDEQLLFITWLREPRRRPTIADRP